MSWVTALKSDDSDKPPLVKIRDDKPADLVDACFTNNGTVKIAETQVYSGATPCNALYPAFATPRLVAGEPLANDVLKCQLKPVRASDYAVAFTSTELSTLKSIFPNGVCDYARPGVEQQPTEVVWGSFGN